VVGYFEEYPDYMTQGKTLEELKENLLDIYKLFILTFHIFNFLLLPTNSFLINFFIKKQK